MVFNSMSSPKSISPDNDASTKLSSRLNERCGSQSARRTELPVAGNVANCCQNGTDPILLGVSGVAATNCCACVSDLSSKLVMLSTKPASADGPHSGTTK